MATLRSSSTSCKSDAPAAMSVHSQWGNSVIWTEFLIQRSISAGTFHDDALYCFCVFHRVCF